VIDIASSINRRYWRR